MAVEHIDTEVSKIERATRMDMERKESDKYELENAEIDSNSFRNLSFDGEVEPGLHARTYIALAAMVLLNYVQILALQGPPVVLTFIGTDLGNTAVQTWVPNALVLVQAVLGPIISSASDIFQVRKPLMVGSCVLAFIGAAIAPGSSNIYRLIGANILIGFGFATVPLAYSVPSEILPRRWRPIAQAMTNAAALLACVSGPLVIGTLTQRNAHTGWRIYYWIQTGIWGLTALGLFVGYHPPKRHAALDNISNRRKLGHLDLIGCGLLALGLTLFLTGTSLGGSIYSWTNARVLATLIPGVLGLVAFGLYEWKGTQTGILHHDLFRGGRHRGGTFALCVALIFIEGIMTFAFSIFYPVMSGLFTTDAFEVVTRSQPYFVAALISTVVWGYFSSRLRTIRSPMVVGFIIMTGGLVGWTTIQPGDSISAMAFAGLSGIGFGGPLILAVTGAQLATPHRLIATATACTTSSRAVAAGIFTAIFAATFNSRMSSNLPKYIARTAEAAGLPTDSIPEFTQALISNNSTALRGIPGVGPEVVALATQAIKQATADSVRIVFIIAVPFGVLGTIVSLFLGDLKKTMNYRVDAPVEELHAKHAYPNETAERV
ncbi:uncharacterized protein A1O9_00523 [Exophiala aquamarina CBS 119918]|uniref:Major facilitator superfamily (MFS) profile domain-containing protein n=1 Tax=Exophiala aquamarina CBS 119918 TaxID=1182545 RepID=A0A072Q3R4_9EURO|nr:uncharacterized protein A1O9_00523 [Exophiala aquamarina CBS 119918]KEF62550.1 hypothetical protein A1O9_00523 [Exophiala aquamarina CBS 119918]